jgi:hypothetical protein
MTKSQDSYIDWGLLGEGTMRINVVIQDDRDDHHLETESSGFWSLISKEQH